LHSNASPAANPTAVIPAFPLDRTLSSQSGQVVLGQDAQSRSPGAIPAGTALLLPASSQPQFAIYEFSGVTADVDHLDVALTSAPRP
jgi:hypothetical protein